jgi:hypothetical protein
VRRVQAQVARYAADWQRANRAALAAAGPLWAALGDSMTLGIGASAYDQGWVGQLGRQLTRDGQHYRSSTWPSAAPGSPTSWTASSPRWPGSVSGRTW